MRGNSSLTTIIELFEKLTKESAEGKTVAVDYMNISKALEKYMVHKVKAGP